MRILDIGRAVADLTLWLSRVGAWIQAVGWIHIGQSADILRHVLGDLTALAAIRAPFDVAAAARILGPSNGGEPGACMETG